MKPLNEISGILRARGFRVTPQRITVLEILRETGGHMLPTIISKAVRKRLPGTTEATIYRTLSFLEREGIILATHTINGQQVYELGSHHHHLVCRNCDETIELEDQLLQDFFKRLENTTGFRVNSRHLTFSGQCPACFDLSEAAKS